MDADVEGAAADDIFDGFRFGILLFPILQQGKVTMRTCRKGDNDPNIFEERYLQVPSQPCLGPELSPKLFCLSTRLINALGPQALAPAVGFGSQRSWPCWGETLDVIACPFLFYWVTINVLSYSIHHHPRAC